MMMRMISKMIDVVDINHIQYDDTHKNSQSFYFYCNPHSCKTLCHSIADRIALEVDVRQHCALPQHSCKTLCAGTPAKLSALLQDALSAEAVL